MDMVVGYWRPYWSSGYPDMKIYGLYENLKDAEKRRYDICGAEKEYENGTIARGNHHVIWLKKIEVGDCKQTVNSGAYENIS